MRKTTALTAGLSLVAVLGVMAYAKLPFAGWPWLEQHSRDIIIVRCTATPDRYPVGTNGVALNLRGLLRAEVQLLSVLKGSTNAGNSRLVSEYWPCQGVDYLVFADYHDGFYQAFEKYRMVPLGHSFVTNSLSGKSLNEQIRALLQYRLDMLNREMEQAQEERSRLEDGLKK